MNIVSSISSVGSIGGTTIIYQVAPRLLEYLKTYFPEKKALDIVIISASALYVLTSALAVLLTFLKPKEQFLPASTNLTVEHLPDERPDEAKATFKDLMKFPIVFWILCVLNCLYSSINSFSQFSQGLLTGSDFGLTVNQASNAVTAMGVVNIILSLPVSLSVDFIGRNTWYIIVAQGIGTLAYFFMLLRVNPYAGMILAGISNSVYNAAILPMFAYPVEKHLIGSCYGIMSVAGGLSMFASPLIVGKIIDNYGESGAIYFYFISSALCLTCTLIIWVMDKRSTGILSMTPKQRIAYEAGICVTDGKMVKT